MKPIFKIILAIALILGALFLAAYLYGFFNFLVFSYNFLTAVN